MDQVPETFNKYLFLKRTLQFVFSISVLSFFLCCSSGFSEHPQSFNAYFSTCLFSMFTHTLERKYVFLICNGILAFLAKNSLMASSSPDFQAFNMSGTKAPPVCDTVVVPLVVEEQVLDQVRVQQEHYEEASETEEEQGESTYTQNREIEGNDDKEEGEGGTENEPMVTQDDDDDDGGDDEVEETTMATDELELANTDELNRKFEEFIRKMKEEIRIEAQRQLIAV